MERSVDFKLSDRKRSILLNAVENYIETALPITSEKVQNSTFSNLSSATLRNELSSLEDMGFLKQLHTSGGRIPTTKAYRYYVDNLLCFEKFDAEVIDKVKNKFVKRSDFILEVLDGIAKNVGEIIEYPTFVQMKGYDKLKIIAVNIIPLITGHALFLVQTNAGIINNTIMLNSGITEENCKDASKFLTTNLYNKQICEVLENFDNYNKLFKNQINYFKEFFNSLTNLLKNYVNDGTMFINKGSTTKLLNTPEYKDIDNAKKFLNLVENESEIKDIIQSIDENRDNSIVFSIGDENKDEYADYSIVKANYSMANGIVASIGVVGPQRLDYAKIASALKFITDELKKIQGEGDDNGKT